MSLNSYFRKKSSRVYDELIFTHDGEFEKCQGRDKKARRKYERLLRKIDAKHEIYRKYDNGSR
ncbi:TPA_asm: hypothetical protein GEU60_00570 [Listeria monocytogenes]|nr:hypothetical protein [Listeria monocytogenes]EAH3832198.1 hypothetical protein [Listeria monocytogenes]EBF5746870.1 hypothetical protein [Listeria monocytogenes]MCJ19081.1 hypothetical protein [Listeria monocytogenes]HAA4850132.1 hypothetical protein [Listeria monocytogenes]